MTIAIDINKLQDKIKQHLESVAPGQPATFTEACQPGDAIWQGDLCIVISDGIPDDYELVTEPTDEDRKLVFGTTQGSRHVLDSLDGVELWRPKSWPLGLQGPAMRLTEDREIQHPTHGDVTVLAGTSIVTGYQREWDAEQRQSRRARD